LSFGNSLKNLGTVQEALVLGLMLVSMFVLFYVDMDFTFKLGVAALVAAIIFLTTLASQLLRQMKETEKPKAS
jgi:preprotein translocase subunit SecF